jgi:CII-binding regulator of phage lambda lysogenization HflD
MELHTGTIVAICGGFAGLVSCIYYLQAVAKNFKHDKEAFKAEILQSAKESIAALDTKVKSDRALAYTEVMSKIESVEQELEAHQRDVSKDLSHIRETYNGEIRNLGEKIEGLRRELRDQHGQLVGLLSEMIKKGD